jgi:predicted nucleic acid-binding protein
VIYVDTSVIVRYLTGDDPVRSPAAAATIETRAARSISMVSILEAAHVLRWEYRHERRNIAAALIELISRRNIVVAECLKDHVLRWLAAWRDGTAESIGDALIAASMSAHGATAIITFDRGFPTGEWSVLAGPRPDDQPG